MPQQQCGLPVFSPRPPQTAGCGAPLCDAGTQPFTSVVHVVPQTETQYTIILYTIQASSRGQSRGAGTQPTDNHHGHKKNRETLNSAFLPSSLSSPNTL